MTQKELDIIKNADFKGDDNAHKICREMKKIVGDRTDNFTNPSAISTVKVDMTETIKNYGYSVDLYVDTFGSVLRSEDDVCKNLISFAQEKGGQPSKTEKPSTDKTSTSSDEDLMLELELLEYELELLDI